MRGGVLCIDELGNNLWRYKWLNDYMIYWKVIQLKWLSLTNEQWFSQSEKRQVNFETNKNSMSMVALCVLTKSVEEGGSETSTDRHWRFRWVFLFYQTYRNPRIFSSFGKCAMTPSRNILFIIYLSWRAICKENSPYIHYTEIEEL